MGYAHLPTAPNRHDNLAPTVSVAGNVAWELLDVVDAHRLPIPIGSGTADALADANRLARNLAHEGTENQLLLLRGVEDVEAAPVDGRRRAGEGVVQVPEQRGGVGRVGDPVALRRDQRLERRQQLGVRGRFGRRSAKVREVGVRLKKWGFSTSDQGGRDWG